MNLSTPTNTPAWGKTLIESLTTVVSDIGSKIDLINSNINSKFDELSAQLLTDVKRASDTANDAINMACKNETSIALLRSDHEKLLRCINVENDNIKLRRKCESQENYSRRDNLIIKGVTEKNNEDMSTCKRLVRNIFIQKLNLSEIEVNSINFVRCHRIGKTTLPNGTVNRKRPIIVRFHSYNDRSVVWSARSALKNGSISINENFAAEVEYRRRLLYPILKAAKQSSRFEGKAFINGDTLAKYAFSGRPLAHDNWKFWWTIGTCFNDCLLEIKWIIIFCDIIYYCLCHEIKHHYDKLVIFVANFYIK